MTKNINLRENYKTYVGQFSGNPVEFGFLLSTEQEEINGLEDAEVVARSSVINGQTNEFITSFKETDGYKNIVAYAIYSSGQVVLSGYNAMEYEVVFDYGHEGQTEEKVLEKGSLVSEPEEPLREGYDFLGWHLDEVEYNFNAPVEGNLMLVAKWEETYKSYPHLDNRSFGYKNHTSINPGVVTVDIGYERIVYSVEDYIGRPGNNGDLQILRNFEDFFEANQEYVLSFVAEASKETFVRPYMQQYPARSPWTNVIDTSTFDVSETPRIIQHRFTLEEVLDVYVFSIEFGDAFRNESGWMIFSELKLFKVSDGYPVTLNLNNGEANVIQDVEAGGLFYEVMPVREGYEFLGWYADEELEVEWNLSEPITKATNLYAKWEPLSYAVISGHKDVVMRMEEFASYDFKEGVTAIDATDGDISENLIVDTSEITLEAGVYEVVYKITNSNNNTTIETITLTLHEATRERPYLDTRDFESKETRIANTVVTTKFNYDEIIYTVDVYEGYGQNGRLQVLKNIEGYFEKGKKYVVSLVAQASKKTKIQPYLQKDPVKSPWTNVMANPYFEVDEEPRVIQFIFELEEAFDTYVFSIEFGNAFENGESGWMIFRDIKFFEYDDSNEVSFTLNGGVGATKQYVEEDGRFSVADPVRRGFSFEGWYADEELETVWDYNNLVTEDTTLYAKWAGLNAPEIYDYQDLELRLEELAGFDYLANIKAHDALDGDISGEISVDVDEILEEAGVYEIVYSVTNSQEVTTTKTVTVTVLEATKELPYLDNRDFFVDYQNLSEPQIYAIFGYDEIVYRVTAFRPSGTAKNNMVQIATVLTDVLKPNTTYTFSFDVKAPKAGSLQPYLQKHPKGSPWTNLMNGQTHAVGTEYSTVSTTFTTGATVNSDYLLSIEFGTLFTNSTSNSSVEYIYFKNIQMIEN